MGDGDEADDDGQVAASVDMGEYEETKEDFRAKKSAANKKRNATENRAVK